MISFCANKIVIPSKPDAIFAYNVYILLLKFTKSTFCINKVDHKHALVWISPVLAFKNLYYTELKDDDETLNRPWALKMLVFFFCGK